MVPHPDEIVPGDGAAALAWIGASSLSPSEKEQLAVFVRRFPEARFYRELPAHHDRVEALLGRRLPRWYRATRAVLASVDPADQALIWLDDPGGWYRFDLCGARLELPARRPRNPVVLLGESEPAGHVLGLRAQVRGVWRAWSRAQQRQGRPRRLERISPTYLQLLTRIGGLLKADGSATWAPSSSAEVWYQRGTRTLDREALPAALSALSQAVALDPAHGNAWFRLGIALKASSRLEEALAAIQRSVALTPTPFRNQWWHIGDLLLDLDRPTEGMEALEKALVLDPAADWIHFRYGVALWKLERYEEVLARMQHALSLHPTGSLHLYYCWCAQALEKLGRADEAHAMWRIACEKGPTYSNAWDRCGLNRYQAGDYATAVRDYSGGLAHDPENTALLFNRACSRAMLRQREAAFADLAQTIRLAPQYAGKARLDGDFREYWEDPEFLALTAPASGDGVGTRPA